MASRWVNLIDIVMPSYIWHHYCDLCVMSLWHHVCEEYHIWYNFCDMFVMSLWHRVCEDITLVSFVWCHCDFKIWHHDELIYLISWCHHIFDIIIVTCVWCHYDITFARTSRLWVLCDVTVTLKCDIIMSSIIWIHHGQL